MVVVLVNVVVVLVVVAGFAVVFLFFLGGWGRHWKRGLLAARVEKLTGILCLKFLQQHVIWTKRQGRLTSWRDPASPGDSASCQVIQSFHHLGTPLEGCSCSSFPTRTSSGSKHAHKKKLVKAKLGFKANKRKVTPNLRQCTHFTQKTKYMHQIKQNKHMLTPSNVRQGMRYINQKQGGQKHRKPTIFLGRTFCSLCSQVLVFAHNLVSPWWNKSNLCPTCSLCEVNTVAMNFVHSWSMYTASRHAALIAGKAVMENEHWIVSSKHCKKLKHRCSSKHFKETILETATISHFYDWILFEETEPTLTIRVCLLLDVF